MTPSRSSSEPKLDTPRTDTIPAPPPSASRVEGDDSEIEAPVESRVSSRKRDTIPTPPPPPATDPDGTLDRFDEEPATDRAPMQLDAV